MNSYKLFYHPTYEADHAKKHESKTFNKPYQAQVLEGGSGMPHHQDVELVAILSSN